MSRNERFTKPHFIEKIDLGLPMIFNYCYSVYSTINVIKLQKKCNSVFEVCIDLNPNNYPLWEITEKILSPFPFQIDSALISEISSSISTFI